MRESLTLFESIANSKWFANSSMMVRPKRFCPSDAPSELHVRRSNLTARSLFLNKARCSARSRADCPQIDIFKERIPISPITRYFPDYDSAQDDLVASRSFFQKKFTRLNRSANKEGQLF